MANKETLYAFTAIEHGYYTGEKDANGNPLVKRCYFAPGDVFDPTGFTKEDIGGLIEAGALSRVSPIVEQIPALTTDDVDDIVVESPAETLKK